MKEFANTLTSARSEATASHVHAVMYQRRWPYMSPRPPAGSVKVPDGRPYAPGPHVLSLGELVAKVWPMTLSGNIPCDRHPRINISVHASVMSIGISQDSLKSRIRNR